jgi:glutamine synthetase
MTARGDDLILNGVLQVAGPQLSTTESTHTMGTDQITTDPQDVTAARVDAAIKDAQLHSLRVSFVDQHGLLHTKTVEAARWLNIYSDGIAMPGSLLIKDTGNSYAIGLWTASGLPSLDAMIGAQDMLLFPDPSTFRILPWVDGTGWVLCDLFQTTGEPIELSTRGLCQRAATRVEEAGFRSLFGLELEFHLYTDDSGLPIHPGWDLLSEALADQVADRLEPMRKGLLALGLGPRSIEIELGPGQIEMSFAPANAMQAADNAVLIRSAIGQIARRHGMRASFMCRPTPESFTSGWHLHQSLAGSTGANVFMTNDGLLSEVGRQWLGGLLNHGAASCLLTTPTVNGYKRYRAGSVVPDRIAWSRQHRGAMVRMIGGPGDPATHLENRVGDPAANPYLYIASQLVAGLDGVERKIEPPTQMTDVDAVPAEQLPRSLGDAIASFAQSELYRSAWGDEVVDYLVALKRSEWSRFLATITDWEQKEYAQF